MAGQELSEEQIKAAAEEWIDELVKMAEEELGVGRESPSLAPSPFRDQGKHLPCLVGPDCEEQPLIRDEKAMPEGPYRSPYADHPVFVIQVPHGFAIVREGEQPSQGNGQTA